MMQVTRMLASAFFIRHLTNAEQLADELENKVKGTKPEKLEPAEEPQTHAHRARGHQPRRSPNI